MVKPRDVEGFGDHLNDLSANYKLIFDSTKRLKRESAFRSLVKLSEEYMKNGADRLERIKNAYASFANEISTSCDNYTKNISLIEEEDEKEIDVIKGDFEKIKKEMMEKNTVLAEVKEFDTETYFLYNDNIKSKGLNVDLVKRYPGSYLYREYMSEERRTYDGDISIDCDSENDALILKYMKNDESLNDDIKKMNNEKRAKFISDLGFLELPVKDKLLCNILYNEDNEIMDAWRNRLVYVNDVICEEFNDELRKNNLIDGLFKNQLLKDIKYSNLFHVYNINLNMKYSDVIEDYLKNGKKINKELIEANIGNGDEDELINEMKMIGIELSDEEKEELKGCFYQPQFIELSKIIDDMEYDRCLQKWTRCHKWKLLFRASDHEYKAKSFHECCNDKGPTLVVIKSTSGYIFGGYTTQSWSGGIYHYMRVINRS